MIHNPLRMVIINFKYLSNRVNIAGNDPLVCENCSIEMVLIFICFKLEESWPAKLGINVNERIPLKQIKLIPDTG